MQVQIRNSIRRQARSWSGRQRGRRRCDATSRALVSMQSSETRYLYWNGYQQPLSILSEAGKYTSSGDIRTVEKMESREKNIVGRERENRK